MSSLSTYVLFVECVAHVSLDAVEVALTGRQTLIFASELVVGSVVVNSAELVRLSAQETPPIHDAGVPGTLRSWYRFPLATVHHVT